MDCPTGCISKKIQNKKSRSIMRKISRKPKRRISRKPKRRISRKPKRRVSRKPKRRISRKPKKKIKECIIPTTQGNRTIVGMKNIGNTCYMDSVLFPFIVKPTLYFKKTMFKIIKDPTNNRDKLRRRLRHEIAILHNEIRQNKPKPSVKGIKQKLKTPLCKNLKRVIDLYRYRNTSQEDAGEFLQSLAELFEMYGLEYTRTTYGTNSLSKNVRKSNLVKTSEINEKDKESVVYTVTSDILDDFGPTREHVKISRLLKTKMDSGELDINNLFTPTVNGVQQEFKRRIAIKQVLDSPCILFYITRPFQKYNMFGEIEEEGVNRKRVLCTQKIKLKSNRSLSLNGIVVHIGTVGGGHYIAYFKCNNNWFLYDDLMNNLTRTKFIGSYENLMKSRKIFGRIINVKTHGTIYYYI
jgi:hypothetical protein